MDGPLLEELLKLEELLELEEPLLLVELLRGRMESTAMSLSTSTKRIKIMKI